MANQVLMPYLGQLYVYRMVRLWIHLQEVLMPYLGQLYVY